MNLIVKHTGGQPHRPWCPQASAHTHTQTHTHTHTHANAHAHAHAHTHVYTQHMPITFPCKSMDIHIHPSMPSTHTEGQPHQP